jgi:FixJ family two-component response regulator
MISVTNVPKSVPKWHENGPRRVLRGPFCLVALERVCSNTVAKRKVQDDTDEVDDALERAENVPQRCRITQSLRTQVVHHYARGMTSRQVARTLGIGRTTVLTILKAADVALRPQGRKY